MDVRLTTLGAPSVSVGAVVCPSLPGRPISFGLLVFLGMEGEVTRDRLLSLFWPDRDQEKARHALSQALYELRQELGSSWVQSGGSLVRTTDAVQVDAREFEALVQEGRKEEALDLYAGHFLEGVHLAQTHAFEDWVSGHRARLGRRHRATVETFISEQRSQGDLDAALAAAWKWVRLDPLDDGGQHHLIQLLAETGSRTEALAQYDRYRSLLQKELSLDPLEETLELVEAIRDGNLQPVPSEGGGGATARPGESHGPGSQGREPGWPQPLTGEEHSMIDPGKAVRKPETLRDRLEVELPPTLQLLRPIGSGSMAEVFLAREPHLRRLVAVKVLLPELSDDEHARKRFEREAQAAARINHPHVCTVHSVGSLHDGTPYLVSPFIRGTTLHERLRAEGRLSPEEVRQVIREVASGLAAAHRLGIIHRDVRPDNVLREEGTGRHFLSDFGIAGVLETGDDGEPRITRTGEVLGNPAYISPEQVEGKPLTDRTDVYSLGTMAHELLTGHPPPRSSASGSSGEGGVLPPNLEPLREYMGRSNRDLTDLISRCLSMDPASRPSARDLASKCQERVREEERRSAVPAVLPQPVGDFFTALMERRFLPIMGTFMVMAWLLLTLMERLEARAVLPAPAYALALTTAIFGFIATNILAWFHGRKGKQPVTRLEGGLLVLVAVLWAAACFVVAG